jgi:hypothetical protein
VECPLTREDCDKRNCPFWVHGNCLIGRVDLESAPGLAHWLDALRREMAQPRKQLPLRAVR